VIQCLVGVRQGRARDEVIVTFGVTDLGLIRDVLMNGVYQRQHAGLLPSAEVIRYPALLVWARDDDPETEKLVASYGYWNLESRHYIDILFCGWMFDGQVLPTIEDAERLPFSPAAFDLGCYVACQNQVREISTWEPSGDIEAYSRASR
jgi:hypothetical protein